jgi:hypothetical protein
MYQTYDEKYQSHDENQQNSPDIKYRLRSFSTADKYSNLEITSQMVENLLVEN